MPDLRDYQRTWARRKRKELSQDPEFRRCDAERQRRRRATLDPNIARDYIRERRFRWSQETPRIRSLKDMGLSIVTDLQLRAGLFTFELRGQRTRERLTDVLPTW